MPARFTNRFPQAERMILDRTDALLSTAANEVYRRSQMEVPVDTGRLQGSSKGARKDGLRKYKISYRTPYAKRIHFGDGMNFKSPGTKSRYLSDPAERVAKRIPEMGRRIFSR